ncbi:hypothetical protein CAPTEDRAFT_185108 [Capitella teleta]|uniref:Farnesoic acid O-methyl transferase domain-containing protein n=1 Tax=Capitella teleta TaxID=283909 RepID=R7V7M6_CAPTE|nr:hypothetical protein CAPTEDRAFT_185108 [Capitella teleta]|eukprot:ELU14487.1 hypothetical protein CAPTEDRAFT_185108 [Capitella teleta]
MNTFLLILTITLLADVAICEDVAMCPMGEQYTMAVLDVDFVNHYPERNYIYFGIKACRSAGVKLLFQNVYFYTKFERKPYLDQPMIMPIIGKYIGHEDPTTLWTSSTPLLDCDEMKYFWLKWIEGELSFGQGLQVGSGVLATIPDSDVHAEYDDVLYVWDDFTYGFTADFETQCASLHAIREQQDEIIG